MTTSWPCPPDKRRGSRSARWSIPSVANASFTRSTVSRAGSPRFIGPRATSSKTEPVTPDSWVALFWNPMATRVENSWSGRPAIGLAVDGQAAAGQGAADAPRREPGHDQAQGGLAGLVGAHQADELAVPELEVDVVEDRLAIAGVAVADSRHVEHRALAYSRPLMRATIAASRASRSTQRRTRSHPVSAIAQSRWRLPGRLNARDSRARLRSSTSVSDEMMTGPISGSRPRIRARMLPSVSSPRARWTLADDGGPVDERGDGLDRGQGHERQAGRDPASLEVEHERPGIRGQDEQPDGQRDREQADERLGGEVHALDRRVERPDLEEDVRCPPG